MAKEDFGQRTEVHTPNGEVLLMDAVSQEERVLEWTFFTKTMGGGGPVKRKEVDNDGIMGPEGRVKVAVAVAVGSQSTVVGGRRKLKKRMGHEENGRKGGT